jgi:MFS family permease
MTSMDAPLGRLALAGLVAESTAVQALASFAMLALPAVAPRVAATLDVPAALIGVQIGIGYGGAMATSLVAGSLVRRFGAVRVSQAAMVAAALGALAAASATLAGVALGAVLVGFGYGMVNPAASHLLVRATRTGNRNLVFSIKQTGVPLGGVLAGMVTPPLTQALGWPWAMALVAAAAAALAVALQGKRARWDGDRDPAAGLANPLAGLRQVWRMPAIRALSLSGFAYAAVQLSLSTFCVTLLVAGLGWSLVEAGMVLSVVQVSGALGRLAWGALADRLDDGIATLMVVGGVSLAGTVGVAAMSPAWPVWAVVAVLAAFGAAAVGWNGVYLAEIARVAPPDQVGRVTGLSLFFTYGGVLVGPPTFAALQHLTGSWTATYGLTALPALLGLLLLLPARRG